MNGSLYAWVLIWKWILLPSYGKALFIYRSSVGEINVLQRHEGDYVGNLTL